MNDVTPQKITLPPSLVGKYELVREIAVGGMGIIFLARDLINQQDVVFKFIAPEFLGDDETRIRFVNEAKLTSALEHPHIVRVFGAGQEAGLLYIVYEYLDGTNVKTLLERYGPYPVGKGLEIVIKVCDGIALAHEHRILHRDIKPENILVSPLGDVVKIVDFGIAKSMEDSQKLTQTGFIIGTPEYLSPEQAVGNKASTQSDQYALGVLIYEMITGRLPVEDGSVVELFTKKVRGQLTPIRDRRPEIPQELQNIIDKALATEPAKRYSSVAELAKALREFQDRRASNTHQRPNTAASSVQKRTFPSSPGVSAASGINKRPATVAATSAPNRRTSGVSSGTGQRPTPMAPPQASARPNPLGGILIKAAAAVGGLAAIAAVGFGFYTFWPKAAVPVVERTLNGELSTAHRVDGTTLTWVRDGAGTPRCTLLPAATRREFKRGSGRFTLELSVADRAGIQRVALDAAEGERVVEEAVEIPFLGPQFEADQVQLRVPKLTAASILKVWEVGAPPDAPRQDVDCGSGDRIVDLPRPVIKDLNVQLMEKAGNKKVGPVLRVEAVSTTMIQLRGKLGLLEVVGRIERAAAATPMPKDASWVPAMAKDIMIKAKDLAGPLLPPAPGIKELITSPSLPLDLRLELYDRVRQLDLLRQLALRSGSEFPQPELDELHGLAWPAKTGTVRWVPYKVPGSVPRVIANPDDLTPTPFTFKVTVTGKASANNAILQIPCIAHGWGTYLQVTVNNKWSTYMLGPLQADFTKQPDLTKAACFGVFTVEFDPATLTEGENKFEVRAIPVAGLARVASELLLHNTKLGLKLLDRSGQTLSENKLEQVL